MSPNQEPAPTDDISINKTYEILAHPYRREIIAYLDRHESVTLAELAEHLAFQKFRTPLHQIPESEIRSIQTSLWHIHIPKMEDADMIEYDDRSEVVAIPDEEPPFVGLPNP